MDYCFDLDGQENLDDDDSDAGMGERYSVDSENRGERLQLFSVAGQVLIGNIQATGHVSSSKFTDDFTRRITRSMSVLSHSCDPNLAIYEVVYDLPPGVSLPLVTVLIIC